MGVDSAMKIIPRDIPGDSVSTLLKANIHPLLAQLYAARGVCSATELDDAPASAHVKRTAQESFTPEAFVLRRSMPWALGHKMGLMFVAFGCSLDAFEVQMRRMAGLDDGITDGLFQISKPVTGSYLWCPPMHKGQPDLQQLGL